jgi:hypothetical protein
MAVNKAFNGGIVAGLVVLLGALALVLVPYLQSSEDRLRTRVSQHVERARRLLHQHSQNQERIATLSDALSESLGDAGVAPDVDLETLLEDDETREAVEAESARLRELIGQNLGRNVAQMSRALQAGLRERDRLLADNARLLADARSAIEEGLAESAGAMTGADNLQANRLKGIILDHQAQERHQQAGFLVHQAARARARLAALGLKSSVMGKQKDLITASGIEEHMAQARNAVTDAEANLSNAQARADAVEAEVEALEDRIADARHAAEQARTSMENLETRGADLTSPDGFETFATDYRRLAQAYNQALAAARRLEWGALVNARFDDNDPFAGDVLQAGAESVVYEEGLVGRRRDLQEARLRVAAAEERLAAATAHLTALEDRQAEYGRLSQRAASQLQQVGAEAAEVYADLTRAWDQARETRDQAVDCYEGSARAFSSAGRCARTRASNAEMAIASLAPDAKALSPLSSMTEDAWLAQQCELSAANARIELGRLGYMFSEEADRTAEVLAALPDAASVPGGRFEEWQQQSEQARDRALEDLTTAYDALQQIRGPLSGHWTVAAQAAAAANLLGLLGQAEMRDVAESLYQAVVENQDDQPHLQPFLNRLTVVQRR